MLKILGILNITSDSFSDGGRYLEPGAAIAHARALAQSGADVIDIGAASSNPDSNAVPPQTEIARLASVLPQLKDLTLSIDSFSTPVQRWALEQGVAWLNDIHGFADPALYPDLAKASCKLVVMHMVQERGIAVRTDVPPQDIMDRIFRFFDVRLAMLGQAGIARDRIVLDPGMGFFLGTNPETSLTVLGRLPALKKRYGLPLLVSVSRKSFLRAMAGGDETRLGKMTAAAESMAVVKGGADYIRTHAPGPLRDGLKALKENGKGR